MAAGLAGIDVLVWLTIFSSASVIRGDAFYSTPMQFLVIAFLQLAVIISALFVVGGYNRYTEMRGLPYATEHLLTLVGAAAISSLLVYSAATFDQTMKPSRSVMLLSFVAFVVLSLMYRRLIWSFVAASTANRAFLVLGGGPLAVEFYRTYKASVNRQRLEFVALRPERIGQRLSGPGSPILEGDLDTKLDRLGFGYSGVIVAERIDRLQPELLERLVRTQFQKVRVYTLESFHEAHWRHVPIESLDPYWPLQMGFQLSRNSPFHYLKKSFDLIFSTVLVILAAPLFGLIVLAVWLEDGRPVIFRQARVGRDSQTFTAYKFRTMRMRNQRKVASEDEGSDALGEGRAPGGEAPADDLYTRRDDPRITRTGRWLRKLRLDELPQIWNVLRGEMSLIGPRAEWTKCVERYEKIIPFYHFRHLVKPGITGWAQVNYPYGESEADAIQKLKYDLYYIRNYSLKLDLMIVLKTVYTVFFGKGQ
ncbi:MAG: sugar transferase [Chthoniobacterales bacterium]